MRGSHCQKGIVYAVPVRQSERDVRSAAGGVDAQFQAQTPHERKDLLARGPHCADRHHERVDHDVLRRDAEIGRSLDDFPCNLESHVRIFGNPRVVIRDGDHRNVVLLDERQDHFQAFLLAGHGVQQGTPFGCFEPRLQCAGHGTVYAKRHLDKALHQLDHLLHQRRFGLVGIGVRVVDDARVHIEHLCAARDLLDRILLHGREVARLKFGGENLAPGRIDAFADHAEGFIEADDNGLGLRLEDGTCHGFGLSGTVNSSGG